MIYQQSRERYFGNLVSERLRPGCGEWNRNRSIRRETTRRRPKTIVRPVFWPGPRFICRLTHIFPLGMVRFKSLSMAVWPYCLNALLTTTADDGLGATTTAWLTFDVPLASDEVMILSFPGHGDGCDETVVYARSTWTRRKRRRVKKKKKNDRSRAKIKRNVLMRYPPARVRLRTDFGRRRRLAPSFRYILRDDRRTWSQWTIPKENVLFAIFFFFFFVNCCRFFCRSVIRTHTRARNFSYDSIAGIIRRNYSGNDNAIIFGAPSADVVGNSTPRHFTSPLLGRPSEQICFFVLTASNNIIIRRHRSELIRPDAEELNSFCADTIDVWLYDVNNHFKNIIPRHLFNLFVF